MLNDVVVFIAGEWNGIAQAPVFFVAAALICAAMVGWMIRSIYVTRIAVSNERIKLRDEQLGKLQEKLEANSPSDALVKLGELTATLSELSIGRWASPSREQTEDIRDCLRKLTPADLNIRVAYDARALGRALGAVFQELGWKISGSRWLGGDAGISVYPKSEAAQAIARTLREGGGFDVSVRDNLPTRPLTLDIGEKPW